MIAANQAIPLAIALAGALLLAPPATAGADEPTGATTKVAVVFSEGYETDPEDRGRPVILIAAGLGVAPEVFRAAFKDVRPAAEGARPTPERERANKAVLLKALGKHGVTNDKLDAVSDHYRYRRGAGGRWPAKAAVANALIRDGKVVGYEVVDGGSGYSSPPTVAVPGYKDAPAAVELAFGKDLRANGSVASIKLPKAGAK